MKRIKQVGRKPKLDSKKDRYVFYLNEVKVVKIGKALFDYYMTDEFEQKYLNWDNKAEYI